MLEDAFGEWVSRGWLWLHSKGITEKTSRKWETWNEYWLSCTIFPTPPPGLPPAFFKKEKKNKSLILGVFVILCRPSDIIAIMMIHFLFLVVSIVYLDTECDPELFGVGAHNTSQSYPAHLWINGECSKMKPPNLSSATLLIHLYF